MSVVCLSFGTINSICAQRCYRKKPKSFFKINTTAPISFPTKLSTISPNLFVNIYQLRYRVVMIQDFELKPDISIIRRHCAEN